MLHILWMIIKVILILLGILLGLVLLALLLILFCPVRYRISAKKGEEPIKMARASAGVSWLFHGVSLKFNLCEGKHSLDIRIFGIPILKLLKKRRGSKVSEEPSQEQAPKAENSEIADKHPLQEEQFLYPASREDSLQNESQTDESQTDEPQTEKANPIVQIRHKIRAVLEKLRGIPGKIAAGIRKTALTIRNIYDKIDWWKQFLGNPGTKEALSLVKKELLKLIRHALPTKIEGSIVFGSEDPSVTGSVLALLGISIPFHRNRVEVTPVFDGQNILRGDVALRGRIYGIVLVKAAIVIYFNKNIKDVIYRWKHKEG